MHQCIGQMLVLALKHGVFVVALDLVGRHQCTNNLLHMYILSKSCNIIKFEHKNCKLLFVNYKQRVIKI